MIKLFNGVIYYSTQSALGNHKFAHLSDNTQTKSLFWMALIVNIFINIFNSFELTQLSFLIAVALVIISADVMNLRLTGPQKISLLSTASGVLIYFNIALMIINYIYTNESNEIGEGFKYFIIVIEILWINFVMINNQKRFCKLPKDMQTDGYKPSKY